MVNETQIFGDGKQVIFLFKDWGSSEMAITLKNPLVVKWKMDIPAKDFETLSTMDGDRIIMPLSPQAVNFTVDMVVKQEDMINESSDEGGLLQNLDMFKNVSVSKLFKVINRKLKEREK